jgi:P-type conjugative transfer protein TrbJ
VKKGLAAGILICLLISTNAFSQFAVHDAPSNLQRTLESIKDLAQQGLAYERQAEQLYAAYTQITHQIEQLTMMAQNLARIPDGLNFLDLILLKGNELTALLNATEGLSFNLDQAMQQYQTSYAQFNCQMTAPQVRDAMTQLKVMEMQTNKTSIQLQSISTNITDAFGRLCSLVNGSFFAKGNLDSEQIAAQQAALTLQVEQQAEARKAANERAQTMWRLRNIIKEEMRQCMEEKFFVRRNTGQEGPDSRLSQLHTFTW